MRRVFFAPFMFNLMCCAHGRPVMSREQFGRNLESWNGANVSSLVNAFGYPDREIKSPDGNPVFEYVTSRSVRGSSFGVTRYDPNLALSVTTVDPGNEVKLECKVWFEIKDKAVVNTTFRGNDCLAPTEADYTTKTKRGENERTCRPEPTHFWEIPKERCFDGRGGSCVKELDGPPCAG